MRNRSNARDKDRSLAITIGVDGSTGIRMPRTSCSPARLEQPSGDWSAAEPMEYVDQRGLLGIFGGAAIVEVGLEQPVLRRSINPQPGGSQAVGSQLNVGLSHDKIDIVARLRATVYPKGISPAQRKGDAVGLEG